MNKKITHNNAIISHLEFMVINYMYKSLDEYNNDLDRMITNSINSHNKILYKGERKLCYDEISDITNNLTDELKRIQLLYYMKPSSVSGGIIKYRDGSRLQINHDGFLTKL